MVSIRSLGVRLREPSGRRITLNVQLSTADKMLRSELLRAVIFSGEYQMKHNAVLTITSLLSILFMTFHLTDDIIRGMEPGGLSTRPAALTGDPVQRRRPAGALR